MLCYASVHLRPSVVILIPCVLNPMLFCYCNDTSPLARLNDCGMLATRRTHKGDHRLGLSWGREMRPCQACALRHVTSTPLRICPIFPKQHCRRESVLVCRLLTLIVSSTWRCLVQNPGPPGAKTAASCDHRPGMLLTLPYTVPGML